MALLSRFLQTFIVLGMYNFGPGCHNNEPIFSFPIYPISITIWRSARLAQLPRTAAADAKFKVKIPTIVPHYLYSGKGGWFLMLPPLPPRVLLLLCATGLLCVLSLREASHSVNRWALYWCYVLL